MKTMYQFLSSFLFLWFINTAVAQNIQTTLGSFNSSSCAVGDTITLPVNVSMASGISTSAISMAIDYDTTKLRCISAVTNLNSNISTGFLSNCGFFTSLTPNPPFTASSRRQFRAAWFALTPVAFNGVMFNLRFVVVATGNSSLKWDVATPGNCEYADELADVIPNVSWLNGAVTCGSSLWNFDFNNTSGLSTINDANGGARWKVVSALEPNLTLQGFGPSFNSSSGGSFALINSDSFPNDTQNDYLILKVGTSLVGISEVELRFRHYFRRFVEDHIVEVSNDSLTWVSFYSSSMLVPRNTTITNSTLVRLNISSIAANQPQIWIRFRYVGSWDWFWALDDVEIARFPSNDLVLENWQIRPKVGLCFNAQMAHSHLQDSLVFSGGVYNIGTSNQTNLRLKASVSQGLNTFYNANSNSITVIATNSRESLEVSPYFPLVNLPIGTYSLSIQATSDSADLFPSDNIEETTLMVTRDRISPFNPESTNLVAINWTSARDGYIFSSLINLSVQDTLTGIRVYLDSTSTPGGHVIASVRDTLGLNGFSNNPFHIILRSDSTIITVNHINQGYIDVSIPEFYAGNFQNRILLPGSYYVAAQLFSHSGSNPIKILDDLSNEDFMPWYASMLYAADDGRWYPNGVAYGVAGIFSNVFPRFGNTSLCLPTIITASPILVGLDSVVIGGNITNDGGSSIVLRGVCYSTSPNPNMGNLRTDDGSGIGSFNTVLRGLTSSTMYYARSYAKNSNGVVVYGNEVSFTTSASLPGVRCPGTPSVSDIDGNIYNTVQIGTQCWTQSNLKVSKYRNGDNIPTGLSNSAWENTTSGAYAIYNNDPVNDGLYGKLYNHYAVTDSRGLCPTGWHVPSDAEWTTLENQLGGYNVAGGALKSIATQPTPGGWDPSNIGATNSSGFTALPGGLRVNYGDFNFLAYGGYWWSSSVSSGSNAWYRFLSLNYSNIFRSNNYSRTFGFSVRCLKD